MKLYVDLISHPKFRGERKIYLKKRVKGKVKGIKKGKEAANCKKEKEEKGVKRHNYDLVQRYKNNISRRNGRGREGGK